MMFVVVLQDSVSSVEGEAGYSSETCITGDVDGAEDVSINVEVEIDIKDEILDVSVPSIKIEPEVRRLCVCVVFFFIPHYPG
jgi:hypothetical protein